MTWDPHAPRGNYRKRDMPLGSAFARQIGADDWRPVEWLDDRTCLFCSRPLDASQTRCEHCGARAP